MSFEPPAAGSDLPASAGQDILSRLPEGGRVLAIRLRSMGDTILMTPGLRLLHDWRPDLAVSVLAEAPWNELLENNPAIDSVIPLGGKVATAWKLRRARFSVVVNLHGGPTSALLTRATGAPWRAGFEHFRDGYAYNLRVPKAQQILSREGPVHTAEHVASCLFWLGVPRAEIPRAEIFPSAKAVSAVSAMLASNGLAPGEGYAAIHPAASYPTKQWKAIQFAEAGDFLERDFGLRPVYVCGAGESAILDEIERHSLRPVLRAVDRTIAELIALIAGARLFIGNDAGPAHIAAAAGIPVVVLFGSSHSAVWKPWKAARSAVVQNDFDCNPCAGDRCYAYDEPRCILSITAEQVKAAVKAVMSGE